MNNCPFLPLMYAVHQARKNGGTIPHDEDFEQQEQRWLATFGLGKFETYHFLYGACTSEAHFREWVLQQKGAAFVREAITRFAAPEEATGTGNGVTLLSAAQRRHWEEEGYLVVSNLLDTALCDEVMQMMCHHLNVDPEDASTWYPAHPDLQGLMLQVYQHPSLDAIRHHPAIRRVFEELYQSSNLLPNTDKLSFNPPETPAWPFRSGDLHWDIDWDQPEEYYIQGLLYLNDVPADRGAFTLVPGFHRYYYEWIQSYRNLQEAHEAMRRTARPIPVPGQKGDLIVWRHTLPHAASANRSDKPRFVQYLSFSRV